MIYGNPIEQAIIRALLMGCDRQILDNIHKIVNTISENMQLENSENTAGT